MMHEWRTIKTIMKRQPVFPPVLTDSTIPNRAAIETIDGARISYGELISRAAGHMANVLVGRGVKPWGSCRRANRKIGAGPSCFISRRCAPALSICRSNTAYHAERNLSILSPTPSPRWWSATRRRRKAIGVIAAKVGARGRDAWGQTARDR